MGQELVGVVQVNHALLDLDDLGTHHRLPARLVLLEFADLHEGQPGLLALAQHLDPLGVLRNVAPLASCRSGAGSRPWRSQYRIAEAGTPVVSESWPIVIRMSHSSSRRADSPIDLNLSSS